MRFTEWVQTQVDRDDPVGSWRGQRPGGRRDDHASTSFTSSSPAWWRRDATLGCTRGSNERGPSGAAGAGRIFTLRSRGLIVDQVLNERPGMNRYPAERSTP
jgi:hypothetical protein